METFWITLLIIHCVFAVVCFLNIVEASDYSEVAETMGKSHYISNGVIVCLIPIFAEINATHWLWQRFIKGKPAADYHGYTERKQREKEELEERERRRKGYAR